MGRTSFGQWIHEQRRKRELNYEECIERVNKHFDTEYTASTWRQWEDRTKDDISRERARMVAEGLQLPPAEVFIAAGLIPDEYQFAQLPPRILMKFKGLDDERQAIVEAVIETLFEQQNAARHAKLPAAQK